MNVVALFVVDLDSMRSQPAIVMSMIVFNADLFAPIFAMRVN